MEESFRVRSATIGFFAHAHNLGGMHETNAGMVEQTVLLQQRGGLVLITD